MAEKNLPPLPVARAITYEFPDGAFDSESMIEYGRACYEAALAAHKPAVIDLGETGSIYGATIRGQIHVVAKHFGQIRDVSWISDNFSGIDAAISAQQRQGE